MPGIPPPREGDAEDVIWALQTAETQWQRQERGDALVWLRRAVLSAGEAHHDDRMIELARHAVELAERLEHGAVGVTNEDGEGDGLLVDDADIESLPPSGPAVFSPSEIPSIPALVLPPDLEEHPEERHAPSPPPDEPPIVSVVSEPPSPRLPLAPASPARPPPPAASKPSPRQPSTPPRPALRAGPPPPAAAPADAQRPTAPPRADDAAPRTPSRPALPGPKRLTQELVRPAIRPVSAASHRAVRPSQPPRAGTVPPPEPGPVGAASPAAEGPTERDGARGLLPLRAEHSTVIHEAEDDEVTPAPTPAPTLPPGAGERVGVRDAALPAEGADEDALLDALEAPAAAPPAAPPGASEPRPALHSHPPKSVPPLALDDVDAFADLPDDARHTFATAATQVRLRAGEEVAGFALAYVVEGEVDVAPRGIPVTATHLATGSVLRAQGTPTDAPPVRLVCTTASAHVAVWTDEAVLAAFRSCPWVEDDLRSAADPILALVGMSMGALGRRLDDALRAHVGALLKVRSLLAGEVIAEAGAPVPGLVVVGAGRLELTQQDAVVGELPPGEFLFADQVLAAGSAPFGARAGAGGALVLAGNRAVAQELMVTCPPLLEILAGM
ncbi:MAG: hypothetical protein IPF92_08180 [Myxococcales bacterium]|nr:hypothetical protein [Myxococcales bacterium]